MEPRERLSEGHGGHAWSEAAALARVAREVAHLSTKNATHTDKVMVVLERCAAGIGLTLPHWPDRARLCDHQNPLTLGSDTELLKYCGKRLEVVHGEDTSNGWAYTHALGKLKAYQALLVTEQAFSNVPLADLEQAALEKLMPPLALDREAPPAAAESTKEATAEGAKVTTVATGEHATAAPPAEPSRLRCRRRRRDGRGADERGAVAEPAPMAVEPASLLDAERRVLAEPEAAEAPPAPDAPAPAPAAARPALAVETAPAAPAAAAPVVTPTDALARLAEMEAKAKERFAALDAEDEARRQKKREEQDAKAAARAEAAAARKAAKEDAAEDAESDEDEDAPGDASDEDFEDAPPPKPKKTKAAAPKDEEEEPVETEVVMRKMNPFIYFSQQKRAAVKAEVEASIDAEATPQERNREVLARIGALWKALSDADKQKWKDEAPEKETTVKKKKKKSTGGTPKGAKKEAKAAATAEKMKEAEDDGEPKLKKQSGYMYHNAQNREAAKAAVAAAEPDLPAKEANQAVMKKLAEMWGALDDAAKQKYKDDAPMVEVKAKAPKEPKEPKPPKAPKAAKHLFQSKPDGKKQTSMMSFFAKKA